MSSAAAANVRLGALMDGNSTSSARAQPGRLGAAVLSVTYKARDKPLKERRVIAESIVDTVCGGLLDVEVTGGAEDGSHVCLLFDTIQTVVSTRLP